MIIKGEICLLYPIWVIGFFVLMLSSCSQQEIKITNNKLVIEIDKNLKSRVISGYTDERDNNNEFVYSEILIGKNREYKDFRKITNVVSKGIDSIGEFKLYTVKGKFAEDGYELIKTIRIKTYNKIPDFAVYNVNYKNIGRKIIQAEKWINNYGIILQDVKDSVIWSFQGESTSARADWILPVKQGFNQRNFMGMNNSDYGGGIPVVDLWRRDGGIAKGHLEMVPKQGSLPVRQKLYSNKAESWIEYELTENKNLKKNDSLETFETFIMVHKGDCFSSLRQFSMVMQMKGIKFVQPEPSAFEPVWCAWGYERNFTLNEILGTLPKVKELGLKWVVLDDGFQQAIGDWDVNRKKFPNGDDDMINFVKTIHGYGLKAKLWWAPLAASPESKLYKKNPDMILQTRDETPQYITWWNSYYLAPTYGKTIRYTKNVIHLFMEKWGFDGLKLDGQHMNSVLPDYGAHNIDSPEQAIEQLPQFYKMLYHEVKSIKPDAVIENCPCGTCMSFYNMPYTNQFVSSDPLNSWQIRLKGKVYRAIAPQMAYYGDHVELSDGGDDFATSLGIGAVIGTKFTWPEDNPDQSESFLLTPQKEVKWKKWIDLYNKKMLSSGDYKGDLYDIGFDLPETHVIEKEDTIYYAFYSSNWTGEIELRGLNRNQDYIAVDYIRDEVVAEFSGNESTINVSFKDYLLIEVFQK
jgi:alpha-galactosidase